MNSTLYAQPRFEGKINTNFHHPSLVSNVVFYDTTNNMKARDTVNVIFQSFFSNFRILNNLKLTQMRTMSQSMTPNNKSLYSPKQRMFVLDGKVAERFTRK